jgi:hypothetical protein
MLITLQMLIAAALLAAGASPASAAIRTTKKPPVVKHKEFDPQHPGPDTPRLNVGEAALCQSGHDAAVRLELRPSTRRQPNGKFTASLTVNNVQIELNCEIIVWLPKNAHDKLKAHEEGHRAITEKVYAEVADNAAKVAADKLDGRRFEAEGDSSADAEKAANEKLTAAHTAMIKQYLAETSLAGKKVQDKYDELTAHGANRLEEPEAIKQAWAAFPPPMWVEPKKPATKPATAPMRPTK